MRPLKSFIEQIDSREILTQVTGILEKQPVAAQIKIALLNCYKSIKGKEPNGNLKRDKLAATEFLIQHANMYEKSVRIYQQGLLGKINALRTFEHPIQPKVSRDRSPHYFRLYEFKISSLNSIFGSTSTSTCEGSMGITTSPL